MTASSIKFIFGWLAVFLFRLIPWRPPNVEPMLAVAMPFSKKYGVVASFLFGFLGIVLYDLVTSGWGSWTWVTAVSYGILGLAAHYFFRNRAATSPNFVMFSIPATLLYDGVTMFIGPFFNHQPLALAVAGQIPFTILHLLGNVAFAALLSPLIYRFVVYNRSLEFGTQRIATAQK